MKNSVFLIYFISVLNYAQEYTQIPDSNFEQALIDLRIDSDSIIDGQVLTSEIKYLKNLQVASRKIKDLTGIRGFSSLDILDCSDNEIESLDVSNMLLIRLSCSSNRITTLDVNNTALSSLWCYGNQLSSLDTSTLSKLSSLRCFNNQLTSLELSNNIDLTYLSCGLNQLTSLNLSNNFSLTLLSCPSNQLQSLDISSTSLTYLGCDINELDTLDVRNGNNSSFNYFSSTNNPNLNCILVDDVSYSNENWTNKDARASFVQDKISCSLLSVENDALQSEIVVYPNPTENVLFIKGIKGSTEVLIYSILGKKVRSVQNTNSIDVRTLPTGFYMINISGNAHQISKKFFKK